MFWFVVFLLCLWLSIYIYHVNDWERNMHDGFRFQSCLTKQFTNLDDIGMEIEQSGPQILSSCQKLAPIGELTWDYVDKDHFVLVGSDGGVIIGATEYNSWSGGNILFMRQDGFRYR